MEHKLELEVELEYGVERAGESGWFMGPGTLQEIKFWIREAVCDGMPEDFYEIVFRPVGTWQKYTG